MAASIRPQATPPSDLDGDGVRTTRHPPAGGAYALLTKVIVVVVLGAALGAVLFMPRSAPPNAGATPERGAEVGPQPTRATRSATTVLPAPTSMVSSSASASHSVAELSVDDGPSADPNDLASHFSPSDPVPTAAEVIEALQAAGDHTGIGAFNPPGTSPPLQGLAVPVDFVLPPGYVRHHQFTDQGDPIEPILMFAPDAVFLDAVGRPIELPEDRVVPPDLAPPGLPIRQVQIPPQ